MVPQIFQQETQHTDCYKRIRMSRLIMVEGRKRLLFCPSSASSKKVQTLFPLALKWHSLRLGRGDIETEGFKAFGFKVDLKDDETE